MPSTNPEVTRAAWKRYYARHTERVKARSRAYYYAHRDDPEVKERKRIAGEKYRAENRERLLEQRRRRYATPEGRALALADRERFMAKKVAALKLLIAEAKDQGCLLCGESAHITLDFHHVDPDSKHFTISQGFHKNISVANVEAEIAKCVVLCANCHRKFHAGLVELPVHH
jgi:hypothetical protein